MLTPENLIDTLSENNLPSSYGIILDFLPSDILIRQLTQKFDLEFAVMFTIGENIHYLYIGRKNYIELPIKSVNGSIEILLKHSHPMGTTLPSKLDIEWLKLAIESGSPQVKSVILPIGKKRVTFNINSKYL